MFRGIRRKEKEISTEKAKEILKKERRGVLSVNGDDGYPYGVPINYIYCEEEGKIYFHGARAGHKADAIRKCDKVCFTVYGNIAIIKEEWAPYVQSAIVFGRCRMVEDQKASMNLVRLFAGKYYSDSERIEAEVSRSGKAVQMYEIEIEHISGKEIQEK